VSGSSRLAMCVKEVVYKFALCKLSFSCLNHHGYCLIFFLMTLTEFFLKPKMTLYDLDFRMILNDLDFSNEFINQSLPRPEQLQPD